MAGWGRAAKLPIAEWVQGYDRQALRADLLAGVTVAAFTLPEDLAYAALAGLPPQAGLYASLMAMATYALFGTSRQLAVGPTSALAILVRGGLGGLVSVGSAQFSALAALTTLLVGVFAAVAGLLRLGFLAHFLSRSMLIGFSIGAGLYIGSTQLAKLFGLPGISGDFLPNLGYLLSHLGETHGPSLLVGLGGLTVLLLADHYFPRLPNALTVVLAATAVSAAADLASLGVRTVGPIPQGLPPFGLGDVSWGDVRAVYPLALACFLLSYVEGISLAQVYAARDRYRVDPDRELLALAAINAAAGLAHGLVVGGSGSRSAVSDEAGARSPLAGGVAAGLLLVVILFFAGFLAHLPDPILAAVVLVAVRRLLRFRELRQLLAVSRWEGAVALVTLIGVLGLGLLDGVVIGLGLVLLDLLRRLSAPKLVLLGRVPGTSHFAILAQSPECERIPGLLLCRVEGALLFANALAVQGAVLRRLAEETPPPAAVVLDLGATATLDLTTAEMLEDLAAQLAARRVRLELVALSEPARETLSRRGALSRHDALGQHDTLRDAVDSLTAPGGTADDSLTAPARDR